MVRHGPSNTPHQVFLGAVILSFILHARIPIILSYGGR